LNAFVAVHPGSRPSRWTPPIARPCVSQRRRSSRSVGRIDLALYCAGVYAAMRATAFDLDLALRHVQVNQVGALYCWTPCCRTSCARPPAPGRVNRGAT
jgi:hypothetical protein